MTLTIKRGKADYDLPDNLSHYTTLSALVSIVESGHLWASNVSFLNDRAELEHGLKASLKAIDTFTKSEDHQAWRQALKKAADALKAGRIPNTYAACFCGRPDILSQWRGYGGSEQAVSVTFDRLDLSAAMKKSKAVLMPVIYGKVTTESQVTEALHEELSALDRLEEVFGKWTAQERIEEAHKAICRLLPQFKHNGFRDERELRYVVQQETIRAETCFRAVGNVIVPYLKLLPGAKVKLPIRSVMVGPGRDPELTQRSLTAFLSAKGYEDIDVVLSEVPFRT